VALLGFLALPALVVLLALLLFLRPAAPPAAGQAPPEPAASAPPAAPAGPVPEGPARVLLVTATAGFYHDSIPAARAAVERLGRATGGFTTTLVPAVADLATVNAETLAGHDVVVFGNTTGELPLDAAQKQALLDFVARGGGFLGTHSASDTFYTWPEYGRLLGAHFLEHPWTQEVTISVEDATHPATRTLGDSFSIFDEIYVFRANPRTTAAGLGGAPVHVLLSLDAASVGAAGDFPLAWCSSYGAGRVFYTALGHFDSVWEDARFQQLLLGALLWTAGRDPAPCGPALPGASPASPR
jgi:type 1 glutamine amidotransferase